MALKETCKNLRSLLENIQDDLDKAEAGNKAAAQRVRTTTIKFEKAAKIYRKESIKADKSGAMGKTKAAKKKASATPKKAPTPPAKTKAALHKPAATAKKHKKIPTAKKRATAKLPKAGSRKK